jgi:hypothetical protein
MSEEKRIFDDPELYHYLVNEKIPFETDSEGKIHVLQDFKFPKEYEGIKYDGVDCPAFASCAGELKIITEHNLPVKLISLKTCGSLYLHYLKEVDLSALEKCGDIKAIHSVEPDFSSLKECGNIHLDGPIFEFSVLETCLDISGSHSYMGFPVLKKCRDIKFDHNSKFYSRLQNMPLLEECGKVEANECDVVELPSLRKCGVLWAGYAIKIDFSSLEECGIFDFERHKRIEAPEGFIVGRASYPTLGMFNANKKLICFNTESLNKFMPLEEAEEYLLNNGGVYRTEQKKFLEFCKTYNPELIETKNRANYNF